MILKKARFVTATTAGLLMVGAATAMAAPAEAAPSSTVASAQSDTPGSLFGEAYRTFIWGGGALGAGAAQLVAGAYSGIAATPADIMGTLSQNG